MKQAVLHAITVTRPADKSWLAVASDLVKARLTSLVLASTAVGFYMGSPGATDFQLMLHALLGTGLVAAGASALNQLLEREYDRRMVRTQDRPLPSGRMTPEAVFRVGVISSVAGLIYLAAVVNLATALVGAVTLGIYVFVYTPLKRVTPWNTAIGAIPGALPPLIGWTAATGQISAGGWSLFAIQFLWQVPHFLAISWMYRDQYANAGFRMLSAVDPLGNRTANQAMSHTILLLLISLCPVVLNMAGVVYLIGALLLGFGFLGFAAQFARHRSDRAARQLFYASILYLPLLFALIAIDRTGG